MSFTSVLALIFIALKLIGIITWSWLWVLAPIWIGIPLVLLFYIVLFILTAITEN